MFTKTNNTVSCSFNEQPLFLQTDLQGSVKPAFSGLENDSMHKIVSGNMIIESETTISVTNKYSFPEKGENSSSPKKNEKKKLRTPESDFEFALTELKKLIEKWNVPKDIHDQTILSLDVLRAKAHHIGFSRKEIVAANIIIVKMLGGTSKSSKEIQMICRLKKISKVEAVEKFVKSHISFPSC